MGLVEIFGLMSGVTSYDENLIWVGIADLAVIAALVSIIFFVLSKTKLKGDLRFFVGIFILIAIIGLFCGVVLLVEYIMGKPIIS